jgi:hypothetical protein
VIDLMAALEESLDAAKGRRGPGSRSSTSRRSSSTRSRRKPRKSA